MRGHHGLKISLAVAKLADSKEMLFNFWYMILRVLY